MIHPKSRYANGAARLGALLLTLTGGLPAQVAVDWTCLSGLHDWTTTSCWSGLAGADAFPDSGSSTYSASLPSGSYGVRFILGGDTAVTVDSLSMPGKNTSLEVGAGRTLTVLGTLTTRGTLTSNGTFSTGPGASVDVDGTGLIAQNGGSLSLPITSYVDLPDSEARFFRAMGSGSVLDLSSLATITGNPTMAADTGGRIDLAALTSFDATSFTAVDAGTVLDIPLIGEIPKLENRRLWVINGAKVIAGPLTKIDSLQLRVAGAGTVGGGPGTNIDLSRLASADNSSISVEAGAKAALPLLTAFKGPALSGFFAGGAGCTLDIGSLTSMTSTSLGIQLHAENGAEVIASSLTSTSGSVSVDSLNAGSLVRVESLSSLSGQGQIHVTFGGKLIGAPFTDLSSVHVWLEGPAVSSPDDYVAYFDTRSVTILNHPYVDIFSGAKVSFPALTAISSDSGRFIASGAGTGVFLPALTSITSNHETLLLRAQSGGATVSAPALRAMTGPMQFMADGAGSLVELGIVDVGLSGYFRFETGAELRVHDSFQFRMIEPARFQWLSGATLNLLGGVPGDCAPLEVAGEDRGTDPSGWTDNFQLDRLVIGPGARIELEDAIDNGNRGGAGGAAEALYVDTLAFADAAGGLETNGLHLYYNTLAGSPDQITSRKRCCVEATVSPFVVEVRPQAGRLLEVCPPLGRSILITSRAASYHALKARWGAAPTTGEFDEYAGGREPSAASGLFENRLLLTATREQSLSILIEGDGEVEAAVEFLDFALAGLKPRTLVRGKAQAVTATGDDLDLLSGLRLVGPGGASVEAANLRSASPQRAEAEVAPLKLGLHDVIAVSKDGLEARLDGWLEVVEDPGSLVSVELVGPDKVRAAPDWAGYNLVVENLGGEVPAPLLRLEGHCAEDRLALPGEEDQAGAVLHVFAPGASLWRLGAGERADIPILYQAGCCASALCGIERSGDGEVLRDDRLTIRCSIYVPEPDDLLPEAIPGVPEAVRRSFPARWRDLFQDALPAQAIENGHRGWSPFSVAAAYRELARRALGRGAGALTGQVRDSRTEVPIAGAIVLALRGDEVAASARADDRGNWAIPCLADGDYRIDIFDQQVEAVRGGSPLDSVPVRGGETVPNVQVDVSPPAGPDEREYPAPGAQCEGLESPLAAPLPPGQFWEVARKRVTVGRSVDPNDKQGPTGEGEDQLLGRSDTFHYTIECENLATAGASAYQVVIEDRLDAAVFDLATFHFQDVEVAGRPLQRTDLLHLSPDLFSGYSTYDRQDSFSLVTDSVVTILDPVLPPVDRIVRVSSSLDAASGLARWEIVDTSGLGFLVANDAIGQGHLTVSFTVKPRADLDPGGCALALNRATITFDQDQAHALTTADWRNRIGSYDSCGLAASSAAAFPQPPDGQTGVSPLDLVLAWRAPYDDSADIYGGPSKEAMVLLESGNRDGYHRIPAPLEHGKQYFWQVVPRDAGGPRCQGGSCPSGCCPVWSFTTREQAAPAISPAAPVPPDGAKDIELTPRLSWSGGNAIGYSVYLWPADGDRPAAAVGAGIASNGLDISDALRPDTTYRWMVLALGSTPAEDAPGPTWTFSTRKGASFHRADPDSSGTTDISDAIALFGFLFLGGDRPACMESADINNDGLLDITDGVVVLLYLFLGGEPPAPPGPTASPCGPDPDPEGSAADIGCVEYGACQ
jgi:hypothetical protein